MLLVTNAETTLSSRGVYDSSRLPSWLMHEAVLVSVQGLLFCPLVVRGLLVFTVARRWRVCVDAASRELAVACLGRDELGRCAQMLDVVGGGGLRVVVDEREQHHDQLLAASPRSVVVARRCARSRCCRW